MQENLTSTVSHEMRTPIDSIIYFVSLLNTMVSGRSTVGLNHTDAAKYCTLIMSQLTIMKAFVNDLLDQRQLREGVFSLDMSPFNPMREIENVVDLLSFQAKAKNVQLSFVISQVPLQAPFDKRLSDPDAPLNHRIID